MILPDRSNKTPAYFSGVCTSSSCIMAPSSAEGSGVMFGDRRAVCVSR